MSKIFRKFIFSWLVLVTILFYGAIVLAIDNKNNSTNLSEIVVDNNSLQLQNFKNDELQISKDIFKDIVSTNLGYLTISITIILAFFGIAGVLFYLFNFKPFEDKIKEQEKGIVILRKETEEKIKNLEKEFEIKINNLIKEQNEKVKQEINQKFDEEIKKLKEGFVLLVNRLQHQELNLIWQKHYMWEAPIVYYNSFSSLIEYLERGIEYKKTYLFDLCLDEIVKILNVFSRNKIKVEQKDFSKLIQTLGNIEGLDDKRSIIIKKAEELL